MANSAFKLAHNLQWFRKAEGGVAEEPTMNSRETTPAAGDDAQSEKLNDRNKNSRPGAVNQLVVTFDGLLKRLRNETQLRTNSILSHILLRHRETKGISARQCNIVVDDKL